MGTWSERLNQAAAEWVIQQGCHAVQYRMLTDVLRRPAGDWEVNRARERVHTYAPAAEIARVQQPAGTWRNKILDFEPPNAARKRGPGMVNEVLALIEYGWDLSHPILHCSAQLLFEYLDPDSNVDLCELNAFRNQRPDSERAVRLALSRIAAAVLARGGSRDPRLIRFAGKFLDALEAQYANPADPPIYDGTVDVEDEGTYRRLRPDAIPIDMFTLYVMAFLPEARADARARAIVARAISHLFLSTGEPKLLLEVDGKRLMRLRLPRIFDLNREDFAQQRLPYLIHDLELLARTGTLLLHQKARDLLEWLLTFAGEDGVLRPGDELEKAVTPSQYHYFPLEDSWRGRHRRYTDVTFRAMLILALLDRTV